MRRIDILEFNRASNRVKHNAIAQGINEIMDYLEHMPGKNGKIFSCVNCNHATAYIGDLGKCCDKPLYEVSD